MPIYQKERSALVQELTNFYNEIVDRTVELMKSLGYTTPLQIFCFFNQLNKAYTIAPEVKTMLKSKAKFIYNQAIETYDLRGLVVLLNGGVCRHQSAMLIDILNKMGYEAVTLSGYSTTLLDFYPHGSIGKQPNDYDLIRKVQNGLENGAKLSEYKPKLKRRNITWGKKEVHDDYYLNNMKFPNHQIVLTGNDKRMYLDPMNDTTLYRKGRDRITLSNKEGSYFFTGRGMNQLIWGNLNGQNLDYVGIYERLLQKPGCNEAETIQEIQEIYNSLRRFKIELDVFTKEIIEQRNDVRELVMFKQKNQSND